MWLTTQDAAPPVSHTPGAGAGGDPAHPREIFLGWDISMRPLGGLVAKI